MTSIMIHDLKLIMTAKRVSMRMLAEETGYSVGHIRNVCCGAQVSRIAHRRIEAALGMDPGSIWNDFEISTKRTPNKEQST